MIEIAQHLGDAEQSHGDDGHAEAVVELRQAKRHAGHCGAFVGADHGQQDTEHQHGEGLEQRAAGQHDGKRQSQNHQGEIVPRIKTERDTGQRHGEGGDDQHAERAGDERPDGGDAERLSGASLPGHRVAVERGDDRGGLARHVDHDRRGRAPVLRAIVDAAKHD